MQQQAQNATEEKKVPVRGQEKYPGRFDQTQKFLADYSKLVVDSNPLGLQKPTFEVPNLETPDFTPLA